MKVLSFLILIAGILGLIFSLVFFSIWLGWWYPKNYEYALRLANNASLPEQKAEYLKEYAKSISTITTNPAYIFMTPDKQLDKQKIILEGLIKRFEDVAKLKPSEMAYQTGMQQLTGQETDNQLARISGLFRSAKMRENRFVFFLVVCLPVISALGILGGGVESSSNY